MPKKACPLVGEKIRRVKERIEAGEKSVAKACREENLPPETYRSYVARERERREEMESWLHVGKER